MRKGFKIALVILIVLILLAGGLYIFYSNFKEYFVDEATIETTGVLSINYDQGNKLYVDGNKHLTFTVINPSDDDVYYYIEFKNPLNVPEGKINYHLKSEDVLDIDNKLNSYTTIVSSYILIPGNSTQNYELDFKGSRRFSLELNVEVEAADKSTFADAILANNKVHNEPITVPGKDIAVTDEGLIKNTDDFGTTYYFRGNVTNNYVKLGGIYFRIVRINGDGSVKLILNNALSETYGYYKSLNDISFAGSSLSPTLTSWFLQGYNEYKNILANTNYCNDNNSQNGTFFAANRITRDNIPSFNCLGSWADTKVGLLTVDEAIFAGGSIYQDNTNYFLYNPNVKLNYYTMTGYNITTEDYYPFMVSTTGKIVYDDRAYNLHSVRPVINIIKTAHVTGSGTLEDPYVLSKD